MPAAIASLAVENVDSDSSYLLALMQITEKLGSMDGGKPLVAAFSRALTRQLALPMDPVQRAALARATVPLLERQSESLPTFGRPCAAVTLVSNVGVDLDPAQRSRLRRAPGEAEDALRQALPSIGGGAA